MRVVANLWPFAWGVRLGWATTTVPNPPLVPTSARAYWLRGQAMVFSRGFGTACDQLRRAGVWAEDLRCVGDRWLRRQLTADHLAGHLRGPLILVGHSCGGRYALFTAQQLEALGIVVDLIVCVDVAAPYAVTANVRRAVHLYRSRWRLYPARPLVPAAGSAARIDNIDLDAPDSPIKERNIHHLNITVKPAVREWIVRLVLETAAGTLNSPGGYVGSG